MEVVFLFRVIFRVEVEPVRDVVDLQIARFGKPFAEQDGTVVRPARIKPRFEVFLLFLGDPENRPVIIVRFRRIVPDFVLVGPGGRQDAVVTDGRNGRRLVVPADGSAAVGARVTAFGCDGFDGRRIEPFDHVGRNSVQNNVYRFFRFCGKNRERQQQGECKEKGGSVVS